MSFRDRPEAFAVHPANESELRAKRSIVERFAHQYPFRHRSCVVPSKRGFEQKKMSGFRICGYGRDFSGDVPKKRGDVRRFIRAHQSGDIVYGHFVRLEGGAPGTAWVNLEGEELLAQLPETLAVLAAHIVSGFGVGTRPTGMTLADFPLQPGDRCMFLLESVTPEPRLRMLYGDEAEALAGARLSSPGAAERMLQWRQALCMPPTQLAAWYAAARRALDDTYARSVVEYSRNMCDMAEQVREDTPYVIGPPPNLSEKRTLMLRKELRAMNAHEVAQMAENGAKLPAWAQQSKRQFFVWLRQHDKAGGLYRDLLILRTALERQCSSCAQGDLRLRYLPWLDARLRQAEMLVVTTSGAFTEVIIQGILGVAEDVDNPAVQTDRFEWRFGLSGLLKCEPLPPGSPDLPGRMLQRAAPRRRLSLRA